MVPYLYSCVSKEPLRGYERLNSINGGKGAMKNRVIKKIMAYLLVGAMVITTPMTASASESTLQKAYGVDQSGDGADDNVNTGSGSGTNTNTDTNTNTNTNTDTNTNTNTGGIPIVPIEPAYPIIHKLLVNPTDLQFDTTGEVKRVEATVILDESEEPNEPNESDDSEMTWATEDEKNELRKKIEDSIRWYSEGFESTENPEQKEIVTLSGTSGKSVNVESAFPGEGKIYAWIEADGKAGNEKNDRPTEGDYIAEVTVSVKKTLKGITFNPNLGTGDGTNVENFKAFDKFTWGKRQYDLRKFTILEYSDGTHELASNSDIKLTYSIASTKQALKNDKITATLTEAGNLKISKGAAGKTIKVDIIGDDDIMVKDASITLVAQNIVKTMKKPSAADKTKTLDFGGEIAGSITYPEVTNQDKTTGIEKSTDELVWSSNKPAIVEVKPIEKTLSHGDCTSAEIIAKGVGTAKVTVKSSSGKSAVYTVNVYSIPDSVEITGAATGYTGKPISLKAVLKNEKGEEIPVGTTKLTWSIDKIENKKNPNAKISGKKENATVTPVNLLVNLNKEHIKEATISVSVKATYKYGTNKGEKGLKDPFNITLAQSDVSQVKIEMYGTVLDNNGEPKREILTTMEPLKGTKETYAITYNGIKNETQFDVGQKYDLMATSNYPGSEKQMNTIAWAVTGKGVTYIENIGSENEFSQIIPDFASNAKATFKASYITLKDQGAGKNPKAVKNTKTINITPVKKADSIAFAKPVIVKNPAKNPNKPQTVSFTIAEAPKKSYYGKVEWKVLAYNNKDKQVFTYNVKMDGATEKTDLVKPTAKPNYKSVTINVPGDFTTGSVIKVGAYSEFGVVAYGYIYITEQTKTVIPYAKVGTGESKPVKDMTKKQVTMNLFTEDGKINTAQLSVKFDTQVNTVGVDNKVTLVKNQGIAAGQMTEANLGDTKSYITDPVTYSLDKKSALVVKVDENGKVTPLKRGKATVTIKALNGKSAKVKIEVK